MDAEDNIAQSNIHEATVAGFGDEWTRFDQTDLSEQDRQKIFEEYFAIVPREVLNASAEVADFGVGSGRWAAVVAPKVASLTCIDASIDALAVAQRNLSKLDNCEFVHAVLDDMPIKDNSLDFAYSLGVLHHIPDTKRAMAACVAKLRPGAPFLVYLYYKFDNKPVWYRRLWAVSEIGRYIISKSPHPIRYALSQIAATLIYWPLARGATLAERLGINASDMPLAYYRNKPFYVMRTDALDRFGTQLEQRYTRSEITEMMIGCGLRDIRFSDQAPFWCAIGWKKEY